MAPQQAARGLKTQTIADRAVSSVATWSVFECHQRNRVEHFFNKFKQFRRLATRYDKPRQLDGFVKLATIAIWLR
jgi:transposase